jgi:diaminohydroxyphosphoribosylaminopyrimidine deaminase/5-amino-6-(5-phosphoribosylamino)uracil reductase
VDAIAVGRSTVQMDNPSLTSHGMGKNPVRLIFDSRLRSPMGSKVFSPVAPTWCLATDHSVLKHLDQMKRRGVQVILCKPDAARRVSVADALRRLAARGIAHILVEGGLTLQQSFLQAGFVDEVVWFIAPMIIGNARKLKGAWRLKNVRVGMVGEDLCVRAAISSELRIQRDS